MKDVAQDRPKWHLEYDVVKGPYATVIKCRFCKHFETTRGDQGRGKGAKARGRLLQHIKNEHPEIVKGGE